MEGRIKGARNWADNGGQGSFAPLDVHLNCLGHCQQMSYKNKNGIHILRIIPHHQLIFPPFILSPFILSPMCMCVCVYMKDRETICRSRFFFPTCGSWNSHDQAGKQAPLPNEPSCQSKTRVALKCTRL